MWRKFREPVNGLTHLFGVLGALVGLVLLMVSGFRSGDSARIVAFAIYGCSLVLMFTASTLYHSLPLSEEGKKLFKRLDHISIFLLIAGSFTPFCLIVLRNSFGWTLFLTLWAIAVAGVFMKLFWLDAPRKLSTLVYVGMGWLGVIPIYPLAMAMPTGATVWLVAGGLFYSIGAVVYASKRPDPFPNVFGFHEIWHLFVLAGSFSHFWSIFRYLTPAQLVAVG